MKLKNYLQRAQAGDWAVAQINFSTPEQLRGIFAAGANLRSPLILGTSEGESKFLGFEEVISLVKIYRKKYKFPMAFLNLDHGKNPDWIRLAVDFGYDAVHFDGSALSLEDNIKQTKEIAKYGHRKGALVEGELGAVKGESVFHEGKAEITRGDLTLPEDVERFLKETRVDSLAVAIGNVHGVYNIMPHLDFERLAEINKKSEAFLVLHGGSGIPDQEIKQAIKLGIAKINFNTEIRIAWKKALESVFQKEPNEVKPYKVLPKVQEAIQKKVEEKIILLGGQDMNF